MVDVSNKTYYIKEGPYFEAGERIVGDFRSSNHQFHEISVDEYEGNLEIWYIDRSDPSGSVLAYADKTWEDKYRYLTFNDNVQLSDSDFRALTWAYDEYIIPRMLRFILNGTMMEGSMNGRSKGSITYLGVAYPFDNTIPRLDPTLDTDFKEGSTSVIEWSAIDNAVGYDIMVAVGDEWVKKGEYTPPAPGGMPSKGDLISIEGKQYRVLNIDGTIAELLAMYDATESVAFNANASCFLAGTKITLADGTYKNVEDVTYNDRLKVWDFDNGNYSEADICWITARNLHNYHYYQLTFDDGTALRTTGTNSNHKVYNVDERFFKGVDKTQIGDRVFSEHGIVTVVNKEYIEEDVLYYNLITSNKFDCFANGILTSDRYGNMYPIDDNMMFVKDEREVRPYSEFEAVEISQYWYDRLRLGEMKDSIESIKEYIVRLESQMLPREEV